MLAQGGAGMSVLVNECGEINVLLKVYIHAVQQNQEEVFRGQAIYAG